MLERFQRLYVVPSRELCFRFCEECVELSDTLSSRIGTSSRSELFQLACGIEQKQSIHSFSPRESLKLLILVSGVPGQGSDDFRLLS